MSNFVQDHDHQCVECELPHVNSLLNDDITEIEVKEAIHSLKNNKSPGEDAIPGEFLKRTVHLGMSRVLQKLFNLILQTGQLPKNWHTGIIVPLHKKGDINNAGNYRGISLLSVMSKMFTKILCTRLTRWADSNNKLPEEQAGFRKGYSTVDQIFNLQGLIQKYLSKKGNVFYCGFVDFAKAFDCVNHEKLFYALLKQNLHGRIIKVLQDIYANVKAEVKAGDGLSDSFRCKSGVRQGCILSPFLFAMYINELSTMLNDGNDYIYQTGIYISDVFRNITHLLFADDLVLLSDSVAGLQRKFNILSKYCKKWNMKVNLDKTKVVVFKNGGHLSSREKWSYDGNTVSTVNCYKYLGLIFSCRLKWGKACKTLAQQASKALNMVKSCLVKLGRRDPVVAFKLFDAMITPILFYGAELWGTHYQKDIETVHQKFCKWLLCTGNTTNNNIALGECGRQELCVNYMCKPIKYLLRLFRMQDNRLPKQCFNMLHNLDRNGKSNWCTHVRELLFYNGFGVVWMNQGVGDITMFMNLFKQRVCDINMQKWAEYINNSPKCELYSRIKQYPIAEPFLSKLSFTLKFALLSIRCSTHRLEIEVGRKRSTPREERICKICNLNEIEDELHFMLNCPILSDIRVNFLPRWCINNPTLDNLVKLLMSEDMGLMRNVAIFIKKANDVRSEILQFT